MRVGESCTNLIAVVPNSPTCKKDDFTEAKAFENLPFALGQIVIALNAILYMIRCRNWVHNVLDFGSDNE